MLFGQKEHALQIQLYYDDFCAIYAALIFGDLVNTDNGYWNLILLLIQIVNIVFSPVVTQGMTFFFEAFNF